MTLYIALGVVLVCGTAFIMSEARHALGINEPRDADILQQQQQQQSTESTGVVYKDSQVHPYFVFIFHILC